MKKLFAILILPLAFLIFLPTTVLATTNYGDGNYGDGNYGGGDTPSTNNSSAGSPVCSDSVTKGTPNLFEIRTTKNTATLYFAPPTMPYSNFYIAYSQKPNIWQYGVQFNQGNSGGVLKYTINKLNPNTKYYFMMRPGSGCMAGNWGNTMTAATTSSNKGQRTYYKNLVTSFTRQISSFVNTLFPNKTKNPPQNITSPLPQPTVQTQVLPPEPTPPPPKAKFCFLWWCF